MLNSYRPVRHFKTALLAGVLTVAFSPVLATQASAADLVIAVKETQTTVDPHFSTLPANMQTNFPVFEPLLKLDGNLKLQPRLAESWTIADDKTWIFKIRKDVKFHDGSPFTAEDVVFSLKRAASLPSTNSFRSYVSQIATSEVVDPYTVKVTTNDAASTLGHYLANVSMVSKKVAEGATTDDFNSGKAAIGTGPYKFVSWAMNDKTILAKNPDYWGGAEPWDKVTYRFINADPARVAAVLSGDVDVATITPDDADRVKAKMSIVSRPTMRLAFMSLDATPEALNNGKLTGPNGEKLDKNPLADIRVRQAMKLAIDLDAMVARIFQGQAQASGQIVPKGLAGYASDLPVWKANPEEAKRLLTESGWSGKFKIAIAVANNQLQAAPRAAEAIAQGWTRIGIPTTVASMPYNIFQVDRAKYLFPASIAASSNPLGDPDRAYNSVAVTRRTETGNGQANNVHYSNPEVDKLVEQGARSMDPAKHAAFYEQAAKVLDKDVIILPLWFEYGTIAAKPGMQLEAALDGLVRPTDVKPGAAQR